MKVVIVKTVKIAMRDRCDNGVITTVKMETVSDEAGEDQ